VASPQTRQILARWLLTGTFAGAAAAGLFAQAAQTPPARGAAPARGGAQPSTAAAATKDTFTVIGCIAREGASGAAAQRYTITEKRGDKPNTYRVQGDAKELEVHVGHTLELKGTLAGTGRGGPLTLTVAGMTWISTTCAK